MCKFHFTKSIILTAYDRLKEWKGQDDIDEKRFNQLIKSFQQQYLKDEGYTEKVLQHRNPIDVKDGLLQKLNKYYLEIQNREEMRDHGTVKGTSGYVPSHINELWMAEKKLKSLYSAVKKYCAISKKDFNTIAIHIAEYRAINKLSAKIRKDINSEKRSVTIKDKVQDSPYTFEDWLENKFYNEKTYSGDYVANDSENYLQLVSKGKMTYEELNKIQDAQQKAYDYMIEYSLRLNERQFQRQTKEMLDLQKVIDFKIEEIKEFFDKNAMIYKEVLLPKLHRTVKLGAKFLLPEHYKNAVEKKLSDVFTIATAPYELNINEKLISYPTVDQMKYAIMEVKIRWLRFLNGYKSKIKFDEMLLSKDFKTLIDNYGEGDKLLESYMEGLNFAPDREVYINTRIKNYESVLPKYQAIVHAWDKQNKREIKIQLGEYKRIGYAWVNNGHNASQSDLQCITYRNLTLCPEVPPEGRYQIYINLLYHLATGGAMAFHIAFLRDQLKQPTTANLKKPTASNLWKGTEEQKAKLFEELVAESFIDFTDSNKKNFLNNKSVEWKVDGRSLFYLLNQLKEKKYRLLSINENLGPLIRDNFTNKDGKPYKNVSQNMSGMLNATKNGKPKLAPKIEDILGKVMSR